MIPSLNECKNLEEILNLNRKLVKFECMIQDMYEEEYFVSLIHRKDSKAIENSLIYRYYSDLSEEELENFLIEEINP